MQDLTGYETNRYTCEDIKLELSKIEAFELQVARGAQFSALSVASFLGDFGIGNVIEKNAALQTALERKVQLRSFQRLQITYTVTYLCLTLGLMLGVI